MQNIYRTIFHSLNVGAVLARRDDPETFIIVDINEAASVAATWRNSERKVVGMNLLDAFEGVRGSDLVVHYNTVLDQNRHIHLGRYAYEDSGVPPSIFDIDLYPLEPHCLLITFSNVTDRVRAVDELRLSEAKLRAINESSPDHIMLVGLDGTIEYINRTVPEYTVDQVLGTSIYEYVPQEYRPVMKACFDRVVKREIPDGYEIEYETRSGERTLFETNVGPVMKDGRVTGFITSSRDVTRYRQTESRMNALSIKILEAQENERRRIAHALHDEVGGELASLQISLQMIPETKRDELPALSEMTGTVDNLIEQVRSVSLALRPGLLDEMGALAALRQFFERYTQQTGVQVELDTNLQISSRFAPEIETAAYRIVKEALTNVALHAGTDRVRVAIRSADGHMAVDVEDTGRGFSDVFGSAERETLGLAGMRQRARLLGGSIDIRSVLGDGTSISAVLPID